MIQTLPIAYRVKKVFTVSVTLTILFALSAIAQGQSPEQERRILEEKRKALEETERKILEGEERLVFDYGGWTNIRFDDYNDDDNDTSALDTLDYTSSIDTRFWIRATLKPPVNAGYDNEHSIYVRFKDLYEENHPENLNEAYDHNGPHVDYAYAVVDIRPYWLEIGRRYYSVGQGIAYSNVHDGVELRGSFQNWNFKAFVSHTLPHEDNIDTSVPGFDKESDRYFYGLEGTYIGIFGQGVYGFGLIQRDYSDEKPEDSTNNYTYNSEYFGLGLQGKILPQVHYWAEIIRETGESYVFATNEKENVKAWAGDFGITSDIDIYSHPNISIEYAFGSGDSDRTSVTNTLTGNTLGNDNNFLYFGYLPAGYALSPRLSNLHFFKVSTLLKPLEKFRNFRNLTLGIDYYRYYKDKETGGMYDTDATMSDDDIGSEIDISVSWKIFSDLSVAFQYGLFMPGNAYPDSANDNEEYFSIASTFTF